jgi:hypothetical protein
VTAVQLGEHAGLCCRRREELAIAALVLHSSPISGSDVVFHPYHASEPSWCDRG